MARLQTLPDFLPPSLLHALRHEGRALPDTALLLGENLPGEAAAKALAAVTSAPWLIVADEAGWQAAEAHLPKPAKHRLLLLPGKAKASKERAQEIQQRIGDAGAVLAVGSGSINDLCKYASHQAKTPYAVYATAASMNGYLSPTASLTAGGHKQSLPAHLPRLILADRTVLAAAPRRMTLAGLADTLCRTSCAFDQWLAEQLIEQPFDRLPHRWLEALEPALWQTDVTSPHGIGLLFEALLAGGLAMTLAGSSAPASQSEHMLAHLMDMATPSPHPALHGEMIALTALTCLRLQQRLVKRRPRLVGRPGEIRLLTALLDEETTRHCLELYAKKQRTLPDTALLNHRWRHLGPALKRDWAGRRPSPGRWHSLYRRLGLPLTPQAIGWSNIRYRQAIEAAALTRDRFTILDIHYLAGRKP